MKKIFALIAALAFASPVSANDGDYSVKVFYGDAEIKFDTAPEIVNDRTFVPLRAIAETLETEVEWDGETETVTLTKNGVITTLTIGSQDTKTMSDKVSSVGKLDAAPYIKDERTMVPLRFISETFGMEVEWNGDTHSVYITAPSPEPETTEMPTAESTAEPATEQTTAPIKDMERYAGMYEGTGYELVRNIPELTNDFETDDGEYEAGQHSGVGKDNNGNGVMYVQNETRKTPVKGNVDILLDRPNPYDPDELIDISFDVYCPKSNGTSTIKIAGAGESGIVSIKIYSMGRKCKISSDMEFDASDYFNNNTEGMNEDIIVENGAHINILLNPKGGKSVIKIKNNSNDLEEQVIHQPIFGLIDTIRDRDAHPRAMLLGFSFTAEYETSAKPMFVDNIVTNIVKAVK